MGFTGSYGSVGRSYRWMRLERAARDAEWDIPDGPTGQVVRQLRYRGALAKRRAEWVFVLLIAVIVLGLGFYLGLPFWQEFADGRKQTLDDQLAVLEGEHVKLDAARSALLSNPDPDPTDAARSKPGLAQALVTVPTQVRGATGETLNPPVETGGAIIVTGRNGTILRIDDRWSEPAGALRSAVEAALQTDPSVPIDPEKVRDDRVRADAAVQAFLGEPLAPGVEPLVAVPEALPAEIRDLDLMRPFQARVRQLVASRASLIAVQADTQDRRDRFDRLPWALLDREEARISYRRFTEICRAGSTDAEVIKTCEESWRAQQAATDSSWWQTIAQQAPPGILLLFLLATLAALYRYNMRLAGFHQSRADALTLYADGMVPANDMEALDRLATAIAADKVEFGRAKVGFGGNTIEVERMKSS